MANPRGSTDTLSNTTNTPKPNAARPIPQHRSANPNAKARAPTTGKKTAALRPNTLNNTSNTSTMVLTPNERDELEQLRALKIQQQAIQAANQHVENGPAVGSRGGIHGGALLTNGGRVNTGRGPAVSSRGYLLVTCYLRSAAIIARCVTSTQSGIRELVNQSGMDTTKVLGEQTDEHRLLVYQAAREKFPRLGICPKDWATKRLMQQYLKNQAAKAVKRGKKIRNPKFNHLVPNLAKRDPTSSCVKLAKTYHLRKEAEKARELEDSASSSPAPRCRTPVAQFVQSSSRDCLDSEIMNEWDACPTYESGYSPSDQEMEDDPTANQMGDEQDDGSD
ncbi:hypothetical protein C8F01DRAFT_1248316 [Mycena amicta]|nr:hypothetical protein C8F01DRAFT_1248316 [Mycena amicta]